MAETYTPDNPVSGLPADSGNPQPSVPNRPAGQPAPAPDAPDMGQPADVAGAGATSALGGGPAQPGKPGLGSRVAAFISGGQQSPGSVWRGILSGALTGMAAGAGTGHAGQGVEAGAAAQQKQAQQQFQNQQTQQTNAAANKIRQATWVQLNHQNAEEALKATNAKTLAPAEAQGYENKVNDFILSHAGSRQIGIVRNPDDMVELHKADPGLPQDVARGNIITVPHVIAVTGADGKPTGEFRTDGFYAAYVPSNVKDAPNEKDEVVPEFKPPTKPGEAGTWGTRTIPKGTSTNAAVLAAQQESSKEALKYTNEQAVAKASELAAKAQLELAKSATTAQEAQQLKENAATGGSQLFEGDKAPSQIPARDKSRNAQLAEAERLSMEKFHKHFSLEDAEQFYHQKSDTLKSFTGKGADAANITAFNTAIAHLGLLAQAAAAQNNGNVTALNNIAAELSRATGSPVPATYDAIHAAVTGEVGSVYKKGSPDVGLEEKLDNTFKISQSPKAGAAAIATTADLMMGKVQSLYNKFQSGTRGKSPTEYGINLISPESRGTLQRLGVNIPKTLMENAATGFGSSYQAPAQAAEPTPAPAEKPVDKDNPMGLELPSRMPIK